VEGSRPSLWASWQHDKTPLPAGGDLDTCWRGPSLPGLLGGDTDVPWGFLLSLSTAMTGQSRASQH
jgi:hypothetical protein